MNSLATMASDGATDRVSLIEFRNLGKSFGRNAVLRDISLVGRRGSIHAITGENGAGKSTLMNMLSGILVPDSGEVLLNGRPVRIQGPAQSRALGISTVFQELTLVPNLTVLENLFLGRELDNLGWLDRRAMRRKAIEALATVGCRTDLHAPCGELSIAEQQLIEIAKGMMAEADIFILDEPTAALNGPEIERLAELLASFRRGGKLVFYISHRLDEIFRFCDTISVLKDGQHVATRPAAALTQPALVALMVGRAVDQLYPERPAAGAGDVLVDVTDLVTSVSAAANSFTVRRGEIVGLAGLEGQGQREILRAVAGVLPRRSGRVGKASAGQAVAVGADIVAASGAGIGFVPEDRKSEGLYLPLSIARNIELGCLRERRLWQSAGGHMATIDGLMKRMRVRASGPRQSVGALSGGNQQKVMIGRWLASGIDVLLIEEPTRGVDIGAKAEIYTLLRDFAGDGGAVLVTSSELTELLGLCDRILVVRQGQVVAELAGQDATEVAVMSFALRGETAPAPGEAIS